MTYFCPALDPPLGGSGRKTTTLVRDHEYFIPTKFHQNPSSGSGEEVENVKVYGRRTDGRTTDGRTDDGRCAMTIAHSSLRLRWAKNTLKATRERLANFFYKYDYFLYCVLSQKQPNSSLNIYHNCCNIWNWACFVGVGKYFLFSFLGASYS